MDQFPKESGWWWLYVKDASNEGNIAVYVCFMEDHKFPQKYPLIFAGGTQFIMANLNTENGELLYADQSGISIKAKNTKLVEFEWIQPIEEVSNSNPAYCHSTLHTIF